MKNMIIGLAVLLGMGFSSGIRAADQPKAEAPMEDEGESEIGMPKKEDLQKYIDMLKSADVEQRQKAAEDLGDLALPESRNALEAALRTDTDAYVREASAFALGEIGAPESEAVLIWALENDKDGYVRESSAYSLGILGGPKALDSLKKARGKETEEFVKSAIDEAIDQVQAKASPAPSASQKTN